MQGSITSFVKKPLIRHNTISFNRSNNNPQLCSSTQITKESLNINPVTSQPRISSAKRNTTASQTISETLTTFPTTIQRPINLKKHNTIINIPYLQTYNDEQKQQPESSSQRSKSTKSFKPSNAISVAERKLIRRVTRRLRNESNHNSHRHTINSHRETSPIIPRINYNSPPPKKKINLFLSSNSPLNTNKKPPKQKINAQSRNLKNSLYALKNQDHQYFLSVGLKEELAMHTKESKKFQKPNIIGSFKSPSGNIMKPISSCSLYMKKQINKPNLTQRLIKAHNNDFMTADFKQAIKWEGIRQLWQNHSITLEKLLKNYKGYKWFLEKEEYITEQTLKEFMRLIEIEYTKEFFEDTFELFGYDIHYIKYTNKKDKTMNIKEFFQCIVITSLNVSFEVKIEMLLDIWEIVHTKIINIKEVIYLLKGYLYYSQDYEKLSNLLHKNYPNETGTHVHRQLFSKFLMTNSKVKKILHRNLCFDQKIVQEMFKEEVVNVVNSNERSWKSHLNYYDLKTYCNGFINRLDSILLSIYNSRQKKMLNKEGNIVDKYRYDDDDDF